jgi:membrane protein YdbS with pleckstrin-like domain
MSKIFCSNCGHTIPGNSNFCRYCGAAQHGPESAVYHASGPQLPVHTQPETELYADSSNLVLMERRHLAPAAKIVFFINYLGLTSIVLLALIIGIFLNPQLFGILLVAYIVVIYIAVELVYSNFYFSINGTHFNKEYGVFHKKHVTIPFEQVQNVNIRRTLIDQFLGLASLDIESAGGTAIKPAEVIGGSRSMAEGHLPGLTLKDSKEIHDLLLARVASAQ